MTTQSKSLGSGPVADVVLSNDGQTVYASFDDGYVRAYDIRTGAVTHALHVGTDLGAIDLSPDGSFLGIVEDHILGTTPDPTWGSSYTVGAYTLDVTSGTVNTYAYHTSQYDYTFFDVGVLDNNSMLLSQRIFPGWSGWTSLKELNLATGAVSSLPGTVRYDSWLSAGASGAAVFVGEADNSDAATDLFRSATGDYIRRGNYQDNISGFNHGAQAYNDTAGLAMQVVDQHAYVFNDSLQLIKDIVLDSDATAAAFNAAGTHLYVFENGTHSLVEYATSDWSIVQTIDAGSAFSVSSGHYASQLLVAPQENYFLLQAGSGLVVLANPAASDGTSGPDTLSGTLLDDSLNGLGGDDAIAGNAGVDQLNGGDGNDVLTGGAGADTLDGGAGTDTVDYSLETGAINVFVNLRPTEIYGASDAFGPHRGLDTYGSYDSLLNIENVRTGGGNDSVYGDGGANRIETGAGADYINGGGGGDQLDGGAGNDVLKIFGLGNASAAGGADSDLLILDWSDATGGIVSSALGGTAAGGYSGSIGDGSARSVDFTGIESFDITTGSGNDSVRTGGNHDVVHVGAGDDAVYLGSGGDIADGGAGTDGIAVDLSSAAAPLVWNLATNSYSGPVGSFTNFEYFLSLTAGAGDDLITTSTQTLDDLVYGGAGADIITVYSGHDAVDGGAGSDLLVIDYSAATAAVTVSGFQTGSGGGAGWQGLVSDGGSHGVFFDNIERLDLTTGSGDDFVSGASGDDAIRTGVGADTLLGGAGNDLLDGGAGADHMVGGAGNDIFYVDDSGDVVTENAGEGNADEVRTSLTGYVLPANVEILTWTGAGAGDLRGNAADNILAGGGAGDFFRLQDGGNDSASGGGGNDAFYFGSAYTSADSVDGGAGADQVALQGDYSGGVTLGTLAGVETLVAMTGGDTRFGAPGTSLYSYNIVSPDSTVAAGTQLLVNASTLQAGENLTFDGSAETNGSFFIYGGKGVDTLTGGSGADVFFFAEDGRFAATDHIDGGAGADVMVLRGNYSLVLSGTSLVNVETVVLNSGSDARFYASGTPFSYDITTADDTVAAGQTMTFNGGQLNASEVLHFDGSAETNGNFRLFGGSANDVIKGGAGNDLIYGGLGQDDLTGGAGADVFRYQGAAESSSTHFDTINGFTYGTDHIDLPFTVSGFADHQAVGQVDFATFDADVARLVDSELNPFGAIELSTFGGDVGNRFFLVVDADGDGAYHANVDYVIELPNVVVPPAPDLFI